MQDSKKIVLKQVKIHTKHNEMLLEMRDKRQKIGAPNFSKQGIVAELIIKAHKKEIINGEIVK